MVFNTDYRLNRHHKFQQNGHRYVADLETNDIIEVNDVEWDILSRYGTQTQHQIVEELKEKYKVSSVFDGMTRLQGLGKRGKLLTRTPKSASEHNTSQAIEGKLKLLVPFDFTKEKSSLDYIANLNRYKLLTSLTESADLETFAFSQRKKTNIQLENVQGFGGIRIRQIETGEGNAFAPAWYAKEGYNGLLLLSQFSTDNLLYYQTPYVPIVHYIESNQQLQSSLLETLLQFHAFQKANDTLVVKASWMKEWLGEFGISEKNICVIPDGINITESIGKSLAKQHTAAIFDKSMFADRQVVGLISGFEPNCGGQWISAFARANQHLAIFVYDPILTQHHMNLLDNVVIFGADDEDTAAILPLFFQSLDLVCFPAIPGTPISIVLEAMAYGTPCIAMTKYDLPWEVAGAGGHIKSEWDNFGNFHVSMRHLSKMITQWLEPSEVRAKCEKVAKSFIQKYTWQKTSGSVMELFKKKLLSKTETHQEDDALFPPIFCRMYNPHTGTTRSCAYRLGINRYEHLEKALAETLTKQHNTAEVESILRHFKAETLPSNSNRTVDFEMEAF